MASYYMFFLRCNMNQFDLNLREFVRTIAIKLTKNARIF